MKAKQVSTTRIYLDLVKLLGMIVDITPTFPKAHRYTVGERMHTLALDLLLMIAEVYSHHSRVERIDMLWAFQTKYQVLLTLVRLAGERNWIQSMGRYAVLIELMDGITKQANAWRNSLIKQGDEPTANE